MNTRDNEFSPQESLQVIRSMIETARSSFGDDSKYYLLWGWAVMIACIGEYVLMTLFHYKYHSLVWAVVIPAALITYFIMGYKDSKSQRVKTFVDDASSYLWTAVGFSFFCVELYFIESGMGTLFSVLHFALWNWHVYFRQVASL